MGNPGLDVQTKLRMLKMLAATDDYGSPMYTYRDVANSCDITEKTVQRYSREFLKRFLEIINQDKRKL